jgi:hypothetical protein
MRRQFVPKLGNRSGKRVGIEGLGNETIATGGGDSLINFRRLIRIDGDDLDVERGRIGLPESPKTKRAMR